MSITTEQLAREIVKRISDAAIELAFTRHELTTTDYEEQEHTHIEEGVEAFKEFVEEVKTDVLACLTGDETGCLDPEDDDYDNETEWLRRTLTTHATAETWQPIETVPKDGTSILLYTPEDVETGWLEFYAVSRFDKHGLDTRYIYQWQDGLEPTHWIPLSSPPTIVAALPALAAAQMEKDRCKYGVCEHDVPWNMECVACGPSEFAAAATTEANDE